MKSALVVVAPKKYQDHELAGTLQGLERHGWRVTIASNHAGKCEGALGGTVIAEIALSDVDVVQFDRIAFIGGPGTPVLTDDQDAHRVAREFVGAGKVVGAICLGPTILAAAGTLKGHKATVWTGADMKQAKMLEHGGATYTGDPVTVSGKIITANGPPAAQEFGEKFATLKV